MKKNLFLLVFLFLFLVLPVASQEVTYGGEKLKDTYRQNETLEIVATIQNLSNKTLVVESFNITIVRSKPTGQPKPIFRVLLNFSKKLGQNEGFTVRYPIKLKNLPPDEYNITAYFNAFFEGEGKKEYYIYKDAKFRLLPSIEIPPIAYVVIGIMAAIIILYVGYGIAMRIRG